VFGDVSGMINKLKEAQQEVEKKIRLYSILVDKTSADRKIKKTLTNK
jgi:hypothetical protein